MSIEDGLPLNPLSEPREARVARGAARLDAAAPDWRTQVNPDTLDMISMINCVLGQLFGNYKNGLHWLGINTSTEATRYGFDASEGAYAGSRVPELIALTKVWRAVLTGTTPPAE